MCFDRLSTSGPFCTSPSSPLILSLSKDASATRRETRLQAPSRAIRSCLSSALSVGTKLFEVTLSQIRMGAAM